MKTQVSKKTLNALDRLEELLRDEIKPVPKDWFTIDGYMERFGTSRVTAYDDLNHRVKAGQLEEKRWLKAGPTGRHTKIRIFRVK